MSTDSSHSPPSLSLEAGDFGRVYRLPSSPFSDPVSRKGDKTKGEDNRKDYLTVPALVAVTDGALVPSVTTVLGRRNKPFLQGWAARLAAESMLQSTQRFPERIAALSKKGQQWVAINHARDAAARHTERRADIGTHVHETIEAILLGHDRPALPDKIADAADEIAGFVSSFENFRAAMGLEFEAVETTLFGSTANGLGYAGTADFIGRTPSGAVVIGDWKTSKDIRSDHVLQTEALSGCRQQPNADETALTDIPWLDRVKGGLVVGLKANGRFEARSVTFTDAGLGVFNGLRTVWQWEALGGDSHLGRQVTSAETLAANFTDPLAADTSTAAVAPQPAAPANGSRR